MKGLTLLAALLLAAAAMPAQAQQGSGGTVNAFSAAEAQRARAAAQGQGFTPIGPIWAQAGTLFMYAKKGQERFQLTVSATGEVHSAGPLPNSHPAFDFN